MTKSPNKPPSSSSQSSRRKFLKASAVMAAAGTNTPSIRASTYRRIIGANDRIRMGVIGTGGMGTGHVNAFCNLKGESKVDYDLVALSDVCQPRLDNAHGVATKKQNGVTVDRYRRYHDLLVRDDIDCVLIATPEHQHHVNAMDAIRAGKDVYLEKPMTLRTEHALQLRKVVKASDRVFCVGTQKMALSKFRDARRLIAEGEIGKPIWSQTSYCRNSTTGEWNYYNLDPSWKPGENVDWDEWLGWLGPREWDPKLYARWRRYRDFSTGIVGDLLVHQMTPVLFALDAGWPIRVTAHGAHHIDMDMENHDQVNMTVQLEGGHTMIVAGSTCNQIGMETMIRGHEGTIYLGGTNCRVQPEQIFSDDHEPLDLPAKPVQDQNMLRMDWMEAVKERREPFSSVELGTKVVVAVDLATRSMWEGKAFTFDPETMKAEPA
jgi:predicted dehydrogenase